MKFVRNNIKDTEINHEIDVHLPQLNEILKDFSKEELIKKFFSVEFTRFNNYYKKSKDLNIEGGSHAEAQKDSTRFFINIGGKDDFDWMSLKDFLRDLLQLGKDDVYKVDVKDSFSFFNTDDKHKDLVLSVFSEFQLEGRRISVEVSEDKGRGGRDRGRGKSRGEGRGRGRGGDDRGGFKKRGRSGSDRGGFKKREGGFDGENKPKFAGKRRGKSKPDSAGTGGKRRRKA